jgi:Uma2 family endonuclease
VYDESGINDFEGREAEMSTVERTSAPPLEAGQRLRQPEFHARYHAMPPGTRAELVGGVVVMPSPLGDPHGIADANAGMWLGVYKSRTPGTSASHNATAILDDDNEFQPDCWLRILPSEEGQTRNVGKYVGGCPELVVEIADSSRSIDLGAKLTEYERAGALEYIVFAIDPDEVYWHVRQGDRLVRVDPSPDGIYRSTAFPGLWLDPKALFDDDGLALLATLERGLATNAHANFAAELAAR